VNFIIDGVGGDKDEDKMRENTTHGSRFADVGEGIARDLHVI
jgi:hypothetical protein